jgi:hypothetical protein
MFQLIAAGMSAVGQIAAGQAAKEASDLNAFNIKTDKVLNETQAIQQARARKEEYDLATSANIAAFYGAGRDVGSDKSVQAFLERQQELVGDDLGRIARQKNMDAMKAEMAAMAEKRRGRNAYTSSLFNAAGTIGQGIYQYQTTRASIAPRGGGGGK